MIKVEDGATDTNIAENGNNGAAIDEETRLKEKLEGKKKEVELKNKLMAKKERRNSENDASAKDDGAVEKEMEKEKEPSPAGSHGDRGDRAGSGSRDRRSNSSHRYIVPQRRGDNGRGAPYHHGRGGRGGGGGGGWGGPRGGGGGDYYGRDQYGRGPPPGRYNGRRGDDFRDDFGRGPPPPHFRNGRDFYEEDQYGRAPRRVYQQNRSRSRSRSISARRSYSSRSRSVSRSRSYSADRSARSRSRSPVSPEGDRRTKRGRSPERGRGPRRRKHRRHRSRSRRSRSPSTSGSSLSSSSSSSSSSTEGSTKNGDKKKEDTFTKDQRTVFVNQLIMRTTARDIKRYFRRKVQAKVADVTLLTDKRTGKHKGCAYVEMKSMEDVTKALNVSGQAPDWQRFPILIKPSEAEKNYIIPASSVTVTSSMMGGSVSAAPIVGPNGQLIEAQKVYVGSLDPAITQEHLFKLFSQFGDLTKVQLQMEPASGISKGFAFLSFRDPKDANLAIQTMSNQVLGGRPMKTGWATQPSSTPGVQVITSEEFPVDASARAQKAHIALAQLAIGAASSIATPASVGGNSSYRTTPTSTPGSVPTVAEARHNLAASAASGILGAATNLPTPAASSNAPAAATSLASGDAKVIGREDNPSKHLLISNMFDKDEETEPGWAEDIKEEFQEECQKFGKIENVVVMSKDPGGKIYASFETIEAAKMCASSLAGRWFDKRQLRVEFVDASAIPEHA